MTKNHISICAVALLFTSMVLAGGGDADSRVARELRMAELAIASHLVVQRSPKTRYLCTEIPAACTGPSKGELGLAFLARQAPRPAVERLAGLLRFKMDGSLATDFQCYALGQGSAMRKELSRLSSAALRKQCEQEIATIVRGAPVFDGLDVAAVCADEKQILTASQDLSDAIDKKARCSEGDF